MKLIHFNSIQILTLNMDQDDPKNRNKNSHESMGHLNIVLKSADLEYVSVLTLFLIHYSLDLRSPKLCPGPIQNAYPSNVQASLF